jgi:uncharacterized protein
MRDFPQSRYYSFSEFLHQRYGEKVWKISVDAGFSCPNRDGLKGTGGCIFCRLDSFSAMASWRNVDVATQINDGLTGAIKRRGIRKFIVYFQASTNTHAPVEILRENFLTALSHPEVVGLSISTRPDCLPPDVLDLIKELSERVDVWVELGLQSAHDATLERIDRGHSFADYATAVARLRPLPVRICTHLMLGLPGETQEQMIETARRIADLGGHEVKLHPMLILKETTLESLYRSGEVQAMELREYARIACDMIEQLPPGMVLQRLTAEAPADMLLAPLWALDKMRVRGAIEEELQRRDSRQGACWHQKADS